MSMDKAIEHGKEKRKQYRGARAVSSMCRNLSCPWCYGNKTHKNKRREPIGQEWPLKTFISSI